MKTKKPNFEKIYQVLDTLITDQQFKNTLILVINMARDTKGTPGFEPGPYEIIRRIKENIQTIQAML